MIGAGAVVTKSAHDGAVVIGKPAHVVRYVGLGVANERTDFGRAEQCADL